MARWRPLVDEASLRFGIPADWIERVMRAESAGRAVLDGRPITSSAGAMGLMQLMPGTWADMRAVLCLGRNPHAPRDNILAGAAYLRLMHDRFGFPGMFAAYHAGPARYGECLAGTRALPRETRAYVAAVAGRPAAPCGVRQGAPPAPSAPRPALFLVGGGAGTQARSNTGGGSLFALPERDATGTAPAADARDEFRK
ncbi:lytic transglycosylase domain-containing protein [Sphingosinicella microcystinivorans]|uniref:lytic transglycosylase domain-containing protein n=1 Tax=Sphingosinicella microcystinivorans TaxID=335406 RepID=UPI0022F380BA|nr:lytic transglycosylase domain-containing protein [Sphingosinicella microcystinivorans]WBX84011.1 lytic transglycosylase domain-containing protein [Sphingosinicella microcystinivorans]